MSKKFMGNTEYVNGIAKLVDNIERSLVPDENGNINPFIEIPEEFDPRYPVVMSSINTVINNADIYGLWMNDLHHEALLFAEEKGILIGAIKDESTSRDEMMRMLRFNGKRINAVLCAELYKELMDAFYYVGYEYAKQLAELTDLQYSDMVVVFRKLVDLDETYHFDNYLRVSIAENVDAAKNVFMNDYTIFTYIYSLRQLLATAIADMWYTVTREFVYASGHRIKDIPNPAYALSSVATTYLYVIDQVFNVILTNFQPKVQFCYSNSFDLERMILDGSIRNEDPEDKE